MSHRHTVQEIYACFGRGDLQGILSRLAPAVDWEYAATTDEIPWLRRRNGPDEVAIFFAELAALDLHRFEPHALLESPDGRMVVALVNLEATVKATGRRIVERDLPHVWHFDDGGTVTRFRHGADTLQHARAIRRTA